MTERATPDTIAQALWAVMLGCETVNSLTALGHCARVAIENMPEHHRPALRRVFATAYTGVEA